ncbi:MAG TPA: LysR family transcriptional regulator, partial [Massilia timonae]|nr:LysR family transcriptional regulator [Massilia timonae]
LVEVLPDYATPGLTMHVVWPKAKQDVPRVRELVDVLRAALSEPAA